MISSVGKDVHLNALACALMANSALHPILFEGTSPKATSKLMRTRDFGELPIRCLSVGKGAGIYLEMNFMIGSAGLQVLSAGLDSLWKENFQRLHATPERLKTWALANDQHRVILSIPPYVVDMRNQLLGRLPQLIELLGEAHKASPITLAAP
jgi:hypothetical protein